MTLDTEFGVDFPDFKEIEQRCREKIIKNYPKYKNSWKDNFTSIDFWKKRLKGEIDEIFSAKSPEQYIDEIPDAINILAMMFSSAVKKCTKCNKTIINFHSLDGNILCTECYLN